MLKIIAGKFRNCLISTVKRINYRPSTSKIKEAIFSILTSGEFIDNKLFTKDTRVLDLFSGSGGLAFEALSRGAGYATFIDINPQSLSIAKKFAESLKLLAHTNFVNINALSLPKTSEAFDLIFIDPPYYNNIVPQIMHLLIKNSWLNNGSIIVIEMAKTDN